jgi:hypothetical protein
MDWEEQAEVGGEREAPRGGGANKGAGACLREREERERERERERESNKAASWSSDAGEGNRSGCFYLPTGAGSEVGAREVVRRRGGNGSAHAMPSALSNAADGLERDRKSGLSGKLGPESVVHYGGEKIERSTKSIAEKSVVVHSLLAAGAAAARQRLREKELLQLSLQQHQHQQQQQHQHQYTQQQQQQTHSQRAVHTAANAGGQAAGHAVGEGVGGGHALRGGQSVGDESGAQHACVDRDYPPAEIRNDRHKAATWWVGKRIVKQVQPLHRAWIEP